jgi:glucan phosphoethanolaminetransferase (alkaline phosphatase superfamily)
MKSWLSNILKLLWAIYLLATSLYCLLAVPPYTYYALIKAPPYDWMVWFTNHHALLYWLALSCALVAYWPRCKRRIYFSSAAICVLLGLVISFRPFIQSVQSDKTTFFYALASLVPLLLWSIVEVISAWPERTPSELKLVAYTAPVVSAALVAILSAASLRLHHSEGVTGNRAPLDNIQMAAWSIISHVVLALLVVSGLNLLRRAANRIRHGWALAQAAVFTALGAWLALNISGYLQSSLSFPATAAICYSILLACSATVFVFAWVLPFLKKNETSATPKSFQWGVIGIVCIAAFLELMVPSYVAASDWNGIVERSFMFALWITFLICFQLLIRGRRNYSVPAILAVLVLTGFAYVGLKSTAFLWGKTLGDTDDDISVTMHKYAAHDFSFALAHHFLGNTPKEFPCDELCHVLEQYTNIPNAHITRQMNVVEDLSHTTGARPNIFVFVIDSMRPDYLGAYNHNVDFTPNLDALARDSIVFHNAYTQYSGTTLSEPAIWSGSMLLHSHYVQPFANVNNLEKLVNADGYKMIVSYDTVLSQLLAPADDVVRLDQDKSIWKKFELCSTVRELTSTLDARTDKLQPVFFYAQPMNVHQYAQFSRPASIFSGWNRPGFLPRISLEVHEVDACMGNFVSYLKQRGMYDNSIVIVASDHGDATGELGRRSHALIIYPEVMRVPLIFHLPKAMQQKFVYNQNGLAALTDITPSLDYLLGHRPLRHNPVFGHSLFAETRDELDHDARHEIFMASDVIPVYGILAEDGRVLYATYAYPPKSELFDLVHDPNAQHNVLTPQLKREYDQRVIDYLKMVGDFFGYKPGVTSFLATNQ